MLFRAGTRVEILVRLFQVCIGDMRVYLRRGNVRVPEHLLHGTDIRTVLDQMCRE